MHDIYLQGNDYNDCLRNIIDTLKLFIKLGFIIHPTKSAFLPSKEIKMLGFILNSVAMTVRLTPEKKKSISSNVLHYMAFLQKCLIDVVHHYFYPLVQFVETILWFNLMKLYVFQNDG